MKLGGYTILPCLFDKGHAMLAGKNGEYHSAHRRSANAPAVNLKSGWMLNSSDLKG